MMNQIDVTGNVLSYFIEHAPKTITSDEVINALALRVVEVSRAFVKLEDTGVIFPYRNGYRTLTRLETFICHDMRVKNRWYVPSDFERYCDDITEIKESLNRLKRYGVCHEIMGSYRMVSGASQYTEPHEQLRSIPSQGRLL